MDERVGRGWKRLEVERGRGERGRGKKEKRNFVGPEVRHEGANFSELSGLPPAAPPAGDALKCAVVDWI